MEMCEIMSRSAFRDKYPPIKGLAVGKTVPNKIRNAFVKNDEIRFRGTGGNSGKKYLVIGCIINIEQKQNMGHEQWKNCNQIITIKFQCGRHYRFQIVTNHADWPQLWGEEEVKYCFYQTEQANGWPKKDELIDWCDCC